MSKKKKRNNSTGVVYSTNEDFEYNAGFDEEESIAPSEQLLSVHIEKKGRGGKTVVLIRGFEGSDSDLQDLAKQIKAKCGVGGSVKDGEIIIQGNQRPQVMSILNKLGYKTKQVGA